MKTIEQADIDEVNFLHNKLTELKSEKESLLLLLRPKLKTYLNQAKHPNLEIEQQLQQLNILRIRITHIEKQLTLPFAKRTVFFRSIEDKVKFEEERNKPTSITSTNRPSCPLCNCPTPYKNGRSKNNYNVGDAEIISVHIVGLITTADESSVFLDSLKQRRGNISP